MCSETSPVIGCQAHDAVPQQPGGQIGQHLGRSSSDGQDPGVAVVPLHLGPVHVAGAAVQLHRLVADVRRRVAGGLLGEARPRRRRSRRRRAARRRRACRSAPPRPAGASRRACAAPPGWRSAACRTSRGRGSTPQSARASGRRCRRRARRARSARPRTARRSGRSRCPRSPTRLATGTRTSTYDSSAVSEQCQPILRSDRSTVKPGVPGLDDKQRDAAVTRAAGADRGGHEVGANAAGDERLGAVDDVVVAVAARPSCGCRRRRSRRRAR